MKVRILTLLFLFTIFNIAPSSAISPTLKKGLHDQIIRKICNFNGFEDRYLGALKLIRFNFIVSQEDRKILSKAGYPDDVINDIAAKAQYIHPKRPLPMEGKTILSTDASANSPLAQGGDKFLRWELYKFSKGSYYINFVNQKSHCLNLVSIRPIYSKNLVFGNSDMLTPRVVNFRTRFGQRLKDNYAIELFPHKDNVDTSRWDIWKEDNSFVGTSRAFKKWKNYIPPASILRSGPFYHQKQLKAKNSNQIIMASIICNYSYRDNDGEKYTGQIVAQISTPGEIEDPLKKSASQTANIQDSDANKSENDEEFWKTTSSNDSKTPSKKANHDSFWDGDDAKAELPNKKIILTQANDFWAGSQEIIRKTKKQKQPSAPIAPKKVKPNNNTPQTPPPAYAGPRFTKNKNKIITDNIENKQWYRAKYRDTNLGYNIGYTWESAQDWARNLSVAGGGWRLATIAELRSLLPEALAIEELALYDRGSWSSEMNGNKIALYFSFAGNRVGKVELDGLGNCETMGLGVLAVRTKR